LICNKISSEIALLSQVLLEIKSGKEAAKMQIARNTLELAGRTLSESY